MQSFFFLSLRRDKTANFENKEKANSVIRKPAGEDTKDVPYMVQMQEMNSLQAEDAFGPSDYTTPVVTINSPKNGDPFLNTGTIPITVTATHGEGDQLVFYENNETIHSFYGVHDDANNGLEKKEFWLMLMGENGEIRNGEFNYVYYRPDGNDEFTPYPVEVACKINSETS